MLTFQDYLKKYSSINNKFIDDFFKLRDYKNIYNENYIDFDKVVELLNTRKNDLKSTLLKSYQIDIDFKVKTLLPTGKGRPIEEIMITPNCFKNICMMSRTEKAKEVRKYFIDLEEHIDKYKGHIIESLNKKVSKYEHELKPDEIKNESGCIYVLKTQETLENVYKIGKTENFKNRLKTHQSSHPEKLEIAYVYETDKINQVESCLKNLLKDKAYRKKREFYEIDIDILKSLIKNCECMTLSINNKIKDIKSEDCKYILMITKKLIENEEKLLGKPIHKKKIIKLSEKQSKKKEKTI